MRALFEYDIKFSTGYLFIYLEFWKKKKRKDENHIAETCILKM